MNSGTQACSRARSLCATLSIFVLAIGASSATTATTAEEFPVIKGYILVQPNAGLPPSAFDNILASHGGKASARIGSLDVYVVELPDNASEKAVAALLAHNPHIKFAEPDRLVAPGLYANDAYYGSEWHLQMIQAPSAWDVSLGNGVTVAILDSGVDASHPDLQGKLVPGWNFYDNNSNTTDVNGHGTLWQGLSLPTATTRSE